MVSIVNNLEVLIQIRVLTHQHVIGEKHIENLIEFQQSDIILYASIDI